MRRLGVILLALSILLMAGAAVLRFVVLPSQAQLPGDLNIHRTYIGTLHQAINPQALQAGDLKNVLLRNVPVTVDRNVKVLQTDGSKALVSDTSIMKTQAGTQLYKTDRLFTVDRSSLQAVANFTGNPNVIPAKGLTVSFPFNAGQHEYTGWVNDTRSTTPITYKGETTREGADVYWYTANPAAAPITDSTTLGALPTAIPKGTLTAVVGALGLPGTLVQQLQQVLPSLPDPIPISYTYAAATNYFVSPATGSVVVLNRDEVRTANIKLPGATIPLLPVYSVTYQSSAASASSVADDAKSDANALWLWGTLMPIVLGGVGVALAIGSVLMIRRRPVPPAGVKPEPKVPVTTP